MTTYRNLAEQVTDKAVKRLDCDACRCRTREMFLPGATGISAAEEQLRGISGLAPQGRERLLGVYGGRARKILELAYERPELAGTVGGNQSVLAAEVVFAIRHEFARHLTDIVHRRTMTGLSADLGAEMGESFAGIAAEELGWSATEKARQLQAFRDYNARLLV